MRFAVFISAIMHCGRALSHAKRTIPHTLLLRAQTQSPVFVQTD